MSVTKTKCEIDLRWILALLILACPLFAMDQGQCRNPLNRVVSGGTQVYELAEVESNLGVQAKDYAGKDIVSLGEGYGYFFAAAIRAGAKGFAVDKQYRVADLVDTPEGRRQLAFEREFGDQLVTADVLGSAEHPTLKGKKFDLVVSHRLVNNQPTAEALQSTIDVLKLLKPGGEARIFGFNRMQLELFQQSVLPQLTRILGKPISARTEFKEEGPSGHQLLILEMPQ